MGLPRGRTYIPLDFLLSGLHVYLAPALDDQVQLLFPVLGLLVVSDVHTCVSFQGERNPKRKRKLDRFIVQSLTKYRNTPVDDDSHLLRRRVLSVVHRSCTLQETIFSSLAVSFIPTAVTTTAPLSFSPHTG